MSLCSVIILSFLLTPQCFKVSTKIYVSALILADTNLSSFVGVSLFCVYSLKTLTWPSKMQCCEYV